MEDALENDAGSLFRPKRLIERLLESNSIDLDARNSQKPVNKSSKSNPPNEVEHSDVLEELKKKLISSLHTTSPSHHEYYRAHFNAVDLNDRYFYKQQNHHAIRNWEPKFIWSILQIGLNNSWSLFCTIQDVEFLDYCESLARKLIDPNLNIEML